MSELEAFSAHCRAMAEGRHRPDCPSRRPAPIRRWSGQVTVTITACTGCLSRADRALFAALADEVDRYLAGGDADDEPLFDDLGDA